MLPIISPQVASKDKKLRRVYAKLQSAQQELRDINHEFHVEKEELLDTIRMLEKANSLQQTIIDEFIPPERAEMVSHEGGVYEKRACAFAVQRLMPPSPRTANHHPLFHAR